MSRESFGTIVFVHGTGVRLKDYQVGFTKAEAAARRQQIPATFLECAWGDALGVQFDALSLPGEPSQAQMDAEGEDFARWSWLFADPLTELDKLTIRTEGKEDEGGWGGKPKWLVIWRRIEAYEPSPDLLALLDRGALRALWPDAWTRIVTLSDIPRLAFERSVGELPEARHALARALVAQLHVSAVAQGEDGPSRDLRGSLVSRLVLDWGGDVLAPSGFFSRLLKRTATSLLRRHRYEVSTAIARPMGDILLYQNAANGIKIREFIRAKIASAEPPVTVVAHSLGGIASFDLLAMDPTVTVDRLVTVGSQVPLLHELGALASLKAGAQPRDGFPRWLNVYDPDDFLSYYASRVFRGKVTDYLAESGQPFPDSHSAYFGNEAVWKQIRDF
jgi:hypothetical protein